MSEPYAGKLARTVLRGRKLPGVVISRANSKIMNGIKIYQEYLNNYSSDLEHKPIELNEQEKQIVDSSLMEKDLFELSNALNEDLVFSFREAISLFEGLIEALTNESFILDWNKLNIEELDLISKMSNTVFWFSLLNEIDPNSSEVFGRLEKKYNEKANKSFIFKMALEGNHILKLYLSLVYNREILIRIIKSSKGVQYPSIKLLFELLTCDYIRHIRNALSHASFELFIGGVVFIDRDKKVYAPPSVLTYITNWMNLIQLQTIRN